MLIKIGARHFVLPLTSVEECVELSRADIQAAHGRHLARIRDHLVPYISLREQFGIPGERPTIEQNVIVAMQHDLPTDYFSDIPTHNTSRRKKYALVL